MLFDFFRDLLLFDGSDSTCLSFCRTRVIVVRSGNTGILSQDFGFLDDFPALISELASIKIQDDVSDVSPEEISSVSVMSEVSNPKLVPTFANILRNSSSSKSESDEISTTSTSLSFETFLSSLTSFSQHLLFLDAFLVY